MATRSNIAVKTKEGKVKMVYAHWDGYLECNGMILYLAYYSPDKAEALVNLGNISSLDISIDCPEGHSFDDPAPDCTTFYGRDRGEKGQEAQVFENEEAFKKEFDNNINEEYLYYFNGTSWLVTETSSKDFKRFRFKPVLN